jgi:hypothetical protein
VVSNDTHTVSWERIFSRRGIGASVDRLPEIGLPTKVERERPATLPVTRPQASAPDGYRPVEPNYSNIVGAIVVRLVGALMLEQNDEWAVSRRYMSLESLAAFGDDPVLRLPAAAA